MGPACEIIVRMSNPFLPIVNSVLPEPHASLLNGILFGTKASMPKDFYQALVTTGVLHVIALSGMNISILITLIGKFTRNLGRTASIVTTIGLIGIFVWFVGASPSIIRAAIMGCLALLSGFFGRKNWGLLTLFLSAGVMLLFDFSLIKDLSFQLSFLATLGILLADKKPDLLPPGQRQDGLFHQLIFIVRENLRTTLSAQIFTVPLIAYTFHRISLISPVTNILIEWVVTPIMILGFFLCIIGFLWFPLGIVAGWIVWAPLSYFISVVEVMSKIPLASISW